MAFLIVCISAPEGRPLRCLFPLFPGLFQIPFTLADFLFQLRNFAIAGFQLRLPGHRPVQFLLGCGNLLCRLCHTAAAAPVGHKTAAAGFQGSHRLVKITQIVGILHQIRQLCLNTGGGQIHSLMDLGQIGAALKGVPVQLEQFQANFFGKAVAFPVGGQIDQAEAVSPWGGAKGPLQPVLFPLKFKNQIAAEFAPVPGGIFLPFAFLQGFGLPGEAVEHGPDEFRQGGLAKAVGFLDHRHTLGKIQGIPGQAAKILNITTDQFHKATSSPLSARMPQQMIASFSSSVLSDAITVRMNSPFREASCS